MRHRLHQRWHHRWSHDGQWQRPDRRRYQRRPQSQLDDVLFLQTKFCSGPAARGPARLRVRATITGVTAGTALTGGGTSGKVTLNVDTTKVPLRREACGDEALILN